MGHGFHTKLLNYQRVSLRSRVKEEYALAIDWVLKTLYSDKPFVVLGYFSFFHT
jgi:hypothetical protein